MHDERATNREVSLSLSFFYLFILQTSLGLCSAINETETGFTFAHPGKSYVEYRHAWERDRGYAWTISLRFRTVKSSAFLFHHFHLEPLPNGQRPQVWVRIKKGGLQVSYTEGGPMQNMVLGKGLGRDQWHRVSVSLDLHRMELGVNLDRSDLKGQRSMQLKGHNLTSSVSGQRLTSVISVGGYSPDIMPQRGHFVGCISEVALFDGPDPVGHLLTATGDVETGCHSLCETRDTCQNGGRCVNHYVSVTCDCYGTQSDGKYCENSRVSLTLQGSEWLIFDLYDDEFDGSRVQWNRLAIEFKTTSSEGILFYARELYPLYSHLAISLHNTSLHVSIIFVDQLSYSELFVSMGTHLDDDAWHQLTVVHKGQSVEARLDTMSERMTADRPDPQLRMPPSVYFGGMDVSASVQGLRSQHNFVGCLRGLFFNRESILDRLNTSRVRYHDAGSPPYQGCHAFGSSSLQFTHNGAFAKVEHHPTSALRIQLQFRTVKEDSFLLYTETSAASPKGFLQLSLVDGQLSAVVMSSGVMTTVAVGNRLGDNAWHALSISYDNGMLRIEVDEVQKVVDIRREIQFGDSTYLGFGPNSEMDSAYIGCMRSLKIDGVDLDPVKVIHSQLAVGVTLGDCDLVDWCRGGNETTLCLNGGTCLNTWMAPVCDCAPSGHYEGNKCQRYIDHSTVTFKDSPSFISFRLTSHPSALLSNLSLSLRTIHSTPLMVLMLMQAASNSSLVLEIAEHDALVMSHTSGMRTTRAHVAIPGLTSGYWQNVTILQEHGRIQRISVNGDVIDDVTYTQNNVDETGLEEREASNGTDWEVFVGGRPNGTATSGHVVGFVGCMSQLRIGDFLLELAKMSQGLPGVGSGCTDRCLVDGCNNGGVCVSNGYDPSSSSASLSSSFSISITDIDCDCSMTGWAGPRCDEDLEVSFDGSSLIVDSLRNVDSIGEVRGEGHDLERRQVHDLEIHLTFSTLTAHLELPSAIAAAQGNSVDDFLVVYLTPGGSVSMMWNYKGNKVVLDDGNFGADGRPHRVSVTKQKQIIILQVDGSLHQVNLTSSRAPSFVPATFQLGGVLSNTVHFKVFRNFNGIISNAFLRSSFLASSNSRPIDVFYGFHGPTKGIEIHGPRRGVRPTHSNYVYGPDEDHHDPLGTTTTTTGTQWGPYKDLLRHGGPARRLVDDGRERRREGEEEGDKEEEEEEAVGGDVPREQGAGGSGAGGVVGLSLLFVLLFAMSIVFILLVVRRMRRHSRPQDPSSPGGLGLEPSDEEEGLLNDPLRYIDFTPISEEPPTFSSAGSLLQTQRGAMDRGGRRGANRSNASTALLKPSGGGKNVRAAEENRSSTLAPSYADLSLTPDVVVVRRPVLSAIEALTTSTSLSSSSQGGGGGGGSVPGGIELRLHLTDQRCEARFHGLTAEDEQRNEEEEDDEDDEEEEEEEEEDEMEWDPQNDGGITFESNTVLDLVDMATTRSSRERPSSKTTSSKTQ